MEQLSIFSATLGLSPPWQVTAVHFGNGSNRLDIFVEYAPPGTHSCPVCGDRLLPSGEADCETWYHEDFFRYTAFLHARIPRVACRCGALRLERPWCRAGSRFSQLVEEPAEEQIRQHDLALKHDFL